LLCRASGGLTFDFASGAIRVGIHMRSLVGGFSEGLVTTTQTSVPEPGTLRCSASDLQALA
jgi:hypothetical protein